MFQVEVAVGLGRPELVAEGGAERPAVDLAAAAVVVPTPELHHLDWP